MQRFRRVRKEEDVLPDAPFSLFGEERPDARKRTSAKRGAGFPAWDAEDALREEDRFPPRRRYADPEDLYEEDGCDPEDDPDEEDPYGDEYDDEDKVHPWAFDDGEDDDDPPPARKPQHPGANGVRTASAVLLAAASAASMRLVLSGALAPLVTVLGSEDLTKRLSAMILMAVEGLPVVLGLVSSLAGLALANHPRLAAVLRPLGRSAAFFSALPVAVHMLRDGFALSPIWAYLLLFAAAAFFLFSVRILLRGRQ